MPRYNKYGQASSRRANLSNYSLPQTQAIDGQYNPTIYQPIVYEPREQDFSILQNSIAQLEQRMEKAAQAKANFNEVATKLQTLVNPAEHEWVNNFIQQQSQGFEDAINSGNYGSAIRQATVAGSQLLSKPEVIGRIKYQEDYKKEIERQEKRRDAGEITSDTYDWWISQNDYNYQDKYDSQGNIIAGDTYKASFLPVKDVKWSEQFAKAFSLINPDSKVTGGTTSYDTNVEGETVNEQTVADGYRRSSSSGGQHSRKQVSKDDIFKNMEVLYRENSDIRDSAYQQFSVEKFKLQKLDKSISDLKEQLTLNPSNTDLQNKITDMEAKYSADMEVFKHNGGDVGYKEYYSRKIYNEALAQNLAYSETTDITNSETGYFKTGTSSSTHSSLNKEDGQEDYPKQGNMFDYAPGGYVKQKAGAQNLEPTKGISLIIE